MRHIPVDLPTRPYLDAELVTVQIEATLRQQVAEVLRRRGLVVGMSGGIDSSVSAALAVRALGPARVFGLFMPERDSEPESLLLARKLADQLGIETTIEDISPILEGCGCYERRDAAIRRLVPAYGRGWGSKVVLPGNRLVSDRLNAHFLVVRSPSGEEWTLRLPMAEYREIVAATNFKQRSRKMLEYYHADRLHYAVVGTPNRLEYDQGFFVKGGDGLADVKPIAHLYKHQVYQLAEHLGIPEEIRGRVPTTDTYSIPQTQEEFYFSLPVLTMDAALQARNNGYTAEEASRSLDMDADQLTRAYREIDQKRSTTRYLHLPPLLVETIPEIGSRGREGTS